MSSRPTAIEAFTADPAGSGLILDFDGVLAPIVDDPALSAMPDRVAATLERLAGLLGLLAIVSGRPADFLAARVHLPGVPLLGSYGIERIIDGVRHLDPAAEPWLGPVAEASRTLTDQLSDWPGVRVEEKAVSVAVHWRQAPDQAAAADQVRRVAALVAAQTGLRLEPGKLVEELRPPIEMDKGSAVSGLLANGKLAAEATPSTATPATVAYAGDDLGDLPALRAVREAGGYALVVDHGTETDPALLEMADQSFDGTEAFAAWLAELVAAIGA
ncbi:MAG TPA: trehalose-phosphatase [Streptosporangiaceae bacterium]|jgi:trehalose 6-phosphate phosphatase